MPIFTTDYGPVLYVNGNHHPHKVTRTVWYRHDCVLADGAPLEGYVQTQLKRYTWPCRREERKVITCFRGHCVLGANFEWLYSENQRARGGALISAGV